MLHTHPTNEPTNKTTSVGHRSRRRRNRMPTPAPAPEANASGPLISGRTQPHRPSRLPDRELQGADDLQPILRRRGHRRGRRADGVRRRGLSGLPAAGLPLSNILGALVTMPHKVTTVGLVDVVSPTASIAGACNAVRRDRRRTPRRRPLRRRGLRPRRAAQGTDARRSAGARRRRRRRRLGDRRVAREGRGRGARALRPERGDRRGARPGGSPTTIRR